MIWVATSPDGSREDGDEAETSAAERELPPESEERIEPEARAEAETGALDG
jgi:hypothetical protein